jgi:hypothetical protein
LPLIAIHTHLMWLNALFLSMFMQEQMFHFNWLVCCIHHNSKYVMVDNYACHKLQVGLYIKCLRLLSKVLSNALFPNLKQLSTTSQDSSPKRPWPPPPMYAILERCQYFKLIFATFNRKYVNVIGYVIDCIFCTYSTSITSFFCNFFFFSSRLCIPIHVVTKGCDNHTPPLSNGLQTNANFNTLYHRLQGGVIPILILLHGLSLLWTWLCCGVIIAFGNTFCATWCPTHRLFINNYYIHLLGCRVWFQMCQFWWCVLILGGSWWCIFIAICIIILHCGRVL